MNQRRGIVVLIVIVIASSLSANAADKYFFADGFESGSLVPANHLDFNWSGPNNTSVITHNPVPQVLWGTGKGNNFSGKDWRARLGKHALRVVYPANQYWAEQRFSLGTGLNELWIKFDVRVPTNFSHENQGPGIPSNSKILYLWMDDYSYKGKGATVGWEYWRQSDGVSDLAVNIQSDNANRHTGHIQHFPFINAATDKGRWMSLIFYLKTSSTASSADGVVSLYRRWDGEDKYTRHHHVDNAILPAGLGGFQFGYLMGWHNGYYAQDEDWLIDNFILAEENLLMRRPMMTN